MYARNFHWIMTLTLAIGYWSTPAVATIDDVILNFLEELRARMCHPIPKLGLPALDPLEMAHKEAAVNNKYLIDFTGSVSEFRLRGLSDFVINNLKIAMLPLSRSTIDFTLPMTAFKSLYTAKGSIAYILNLAGDGNAETYVKDFRVSITWRLKTGIYFGIRNLSITIKMGELKIDFENLIEEERINNFFHALVNELGLELLNDAWQVENKLVEQSIEDKLNSVLGQYTLADIIKIIGGAGGGDGPIFGPDDPPGDCKDTTKQYSIPFNL